MGLASAAGRTGSIPISRNPVHLPTRLQAFAIHPYYSIYSRSRHTILSKVACTMGSKVSSNSATQNLFTGRRERVWRRFWVSSRRTGRGPKKSSHGRSRARRRRLSPDLHRSTFRLCPTSSTVHLSLAHGIDPGPEAYSHIPGTPIVTAAVVSA